MNIRDLESMASEIREVIGRYFSNLSEKQWEQLEALPALYKPMTARTPGLKYITETVSVSLLTG